MANIFDKFLNSMRLYDDEDLEEDAEYLDDETEEAFVGRFCELTTAIAQSGFCGMCYTQLTNVEQEQNGLVFYDRSAKFSDEAIAKMRECNMQPAACERED